MLSSGMFQSDTNVSYSKRDVSPGKLAYNTDVNGAEKLYVGRLPYNISKRELEDLFCTYGPLLNVEIKHGGFAFVQYELQSDAEKASIALSGHEVEGRRITVEFSNKRGTGGTACLVCGIEGHWARECPQNKEKGMDVRSGKCFKCGNFGHLARFCRSLILIRGEETGSISNQIRERSPRRTFSRPPPPSRRQHYEPRNLEHQHGLYGYEYFEERSHPQQHYGHYDYAYSEYDYRQYDDRRLRERREYFDNADYYDRYPPRRDYDLSSDFGIRKGERNIGVNPDGNKYPHLYEYGLDSYPKR